MPTFITKQFLADIKNNGRLLDGLHVWMQMTTQTRENLPRLPKLTSWQCVLEEVLDTDDEPEFYARFVNELFCRGYHRHELYAMRQIAWETAGWFNFEMMAWDWIALDEKDMQIGLDDRRTKGNITQRHYENLQAQIQKYRKPPSQS